MSLLSYILPRTVARLSSRHNRDIRVIEENGSYKLLVNGSRQSGEYIRMLWQEAFASFHIYPSPAFKRILVLGVAGGTVIRLLQAIFPDAAITGVDIDRKMIDIGKKFFGLKNVTLVAEDAFTFIQKPGQWDLIIVDVYKGAEIPAFIGDDRFVTYLSQRLTSSGTAIINYLFEYEYKNLSAFFLKTLRRHFRTVTDTKIQLNRFFCVIK